jgi:ArsR family transcriptional regulator, zinc-responsive transcriptional repressor
MEYYTPTLQPMKDIEFAANCLKVMAHPLRLRICEILMQAEYPVKEIARLCKIPQHRTSEHLRLLKASKILGSKRFGKSVYYFVISDKLPSLFKCLNLNCEG